MSLVNLAHVCSHLQNASLARLGLTSIPYTRLHLSLALLLQKQGFFSHVKLGGPSPPASCFPSGLRDGSRTSSHPHQHGDGSIFGPESALQRVIAGSGPVTEQVLRSEGFGEEAIDFAMQERLKSKAQLEREGWDHIAIDFLLRHEGKDTAQLAAAGLDEATTAVISNHQRMLANARAEVERWHGDERRFQEREEEDAAQSLRDATPYKDHFRARLRDQILREGFDTETLRFFAGAQNSLRTDRDLARDGLTINAMGLEVENQPFNPPPPPSQQDPWQLEAEGIVTQANRASRRLWLGLKYWDGLPVLRKATMLSKPTKRIWLTARELGGMTRGRAAFKGEVKPLTQVGEVVAVTTDRGVMEIRECAERQLGGMVLCRVW